MATTGNLTNNSGTFDLYKQNNTITLFTNAKRYVNSDIQLTTKVHKAVLNTNTATNTFDIQIPNGNATDITLTFTVDSNGNVLVT